MKSRLTTILFSSLALGLLVWSVSSIDDRGSRAQSASGCDLRIERDVMPETLAIGARATISMSVRADCADLQQPLRLALVVDNSTDMGGPRMEGLRQGVEALADGLDFSRSQAALLAYHSRVDLLAPMGSDRDALVEASQRFFPRQGHAMVMGVRAGAQVIQAARSPDDPELQEVLILVAGGPNGEGEPEDIDAAIAEAQVAKDDGILVVTVAAGGATDYDMLEAMASSSSLFYIETLAGRYPSLFREILADLSQVELTGALVSDRLPPQLEYAFGSGVPAPRLRDGALTWSYAIWPEEGLQIEYQVACLELGRHPSSLGAEVELSFDRGAPLSQPFPVDDIECVPEPTVTPTSSATPGPSATPSPSPSSRPTRALAPIYLPVTWSRHCLPSQRQADLVLLLDASSSMHEQVGGQLKLQLALNAASRLIDALDFRADRAAVLAFSSRADHLHPLSDQRLSLQLALARIFEAVRYGSRLDLGLDAAGQVLAASPADRLPVVLLLTDGLADGPRALAAAERLRARGVSIYAVGLGEAVDSQLLTAIAGHPSRYFQSPDGADLDRIYLDIARSAGCP